MCPDGEELILEINSCGGSVYMGFEIYTALRRSGRNCKAEVFGIAGSAASVMICGCSQVMMSPVANVMIHRASLETAGNEEQLTQDAQMLRTVDQSILNAYEERCGEKTSREELEVMMENETFMTAQEAIEFGFADGILFQDGEKKNTSSEVQPMKAVAAMRTAGCWAELPPVEGLRKKMEQLMKQQPEAEAKKEEERREEMEIKNAEELRAAYPDIVGAMRQEAAEAERKRIEGILGQSLPGYENLVQEAVSDPTQNAGTVAMAIIAKQKAAGTAHLEGAKRDAENSNANNVGNAAMPEGGEQPKDPETIGRLMAKAYYKDKCEH
jgi:ATP-dependent protease ClpP protease subunit